MRRILRDAAKKSIGNPPPSSAEHFQTLILMRISRESWKLGFNIINKIAYNGANFFRLKRSLDNGT